MTRKLITAALAAALTLAGLTACKSRAELCRADGNAVTSEREWDAKKRKFVTEYECTTPDGAEVDEWKGA